LRSDWSSLVVTGPDRQSWLNGLVTCDLAKLSPGSVAIGLALNKKGKVLTDVIIVAQPDRLIVGVCASKLTELHQTFEHFLIMEDAELTLAPDAWLWSLAIGPLSDEIARRAAAREGVFSAPAVVSDHACAILLDQRLDASERPFHWDEELENPLARSVSVDIWNGLRFDLGMPRFGVDYDHTTYPQECGLEERLISFTKGCYLGQEVVVKLRSRGRASRKLVRLLLPAGSDVPAAGTSVDNAQMASVGAVTSAGMCSALDCPCVFAMVRRIDAEASAEMRIGGALCQIKEPWGILGSE
jgi:hypothetical protein